MNPPSGARRRRRPETGSRRSCGASPAPWQGSWSPRPICHTGRTGICGPEREILLDAHDDAGGASRPSTTTGEPGLTHGGRLCDLMSPTGLAYLILGIGTLESFNALAQTG